MYTRPWMGHEGQLLQGPLLKSFLTLELEKIIVLVVANPQSAKITYCDSDKYTLKIADEFYDLSFTLTYANLNQLKLAGEILDELGALLNQSILKTISVPDGDQVLHLLKPIQRQVLHYYTGNDYLDIGKLFRGEKVGSFANIVDTFLIGCILCHTANQFPSLLADERVYPEEKSVLLKMQQAAVVDHRNKIIPRLMFLDELNSKDNYKYNLKLAKQKKIITVTEFNKLELRF